MKKYDVYLGTYAMYRVIYKIDADSKEEAIKIAKQQCENGETALLVRQPFEYEKVFETDEKIKKYKVNINMNGEFGDGKTYEVEADNDIDAVELAWRDASTEENVTGSWAERFKYLFKDLDDNLEITLCE